jgi:hypothetical protein
MPRPTPQEQVDALVGRITEAWYKLTEFGIDAPLERAVVETRRQGRSDLVAGLRELEELAPGTVGHGGGVVMHGVLRRLAEEEPLALAFLTGEVLSTLADERMQQR